MGACPGKSYAGIDAGAFARLAEMASGYGVAVDRDEGSASARGFTVEWDYDRAGQVLAVKVVEKPFFVPCGVVAEASDRLVASCFERPGAG